MELTRRNALGLLGAGGIALTVSGCGLGGGASTGGGGGASAGGALEGQITFQTWSLKNEKFTPYFTKLVADFEKEHAGTKIKWVDQPGDGYEEKIQQQTTSKQLPDVVNIPPGMALPLAQIGAIVDLEDADAETLKRYGDGGVEAYTFDGVDGAYGYPWYLGSDLNWWNTKAFEDAGLDPEKLPTSTDELIEAARQMAKATGGKTPLISEAPGIETLGAAGIELYKDGEFVFNTPEAAELVQQYVELYAAKAMPPEVLQSDYQGNSQLFMQGKVAWTTGSASFPVDLKKTAPSIAAVTKATPRFGTPPLFVQGLSVSSGSKHPDLALAFAQYVTNNTNQVEFVKVAQGFLPGTKEANEKPETFTKAIEDPEMKEAAAMLADSMTKAEVLAPVVYTDAMKTFLGQQITAAMRGDQSPKDALDKAVKYCNDNLAK
ncbi:sugar ABC transporter substrate-binding protein [uncultured Tessaracoccus sp.]|uniref:ABC transporter substrate-binding protein n=1 Tax=uncultured Tessaracoccus sp. TaxID=905023 RepID=UPI00345C1D74